MTYKKKATQPAQPAQPTPPVQTSPDDLLTVSEFADILRVDDTTVRRWVKSGALEAIILPHANERQAYRIKRSTLNAIISGGKLPQ